MSLKAPERSASKNRLEAVQRLIIASAQLIDEQAKLTETLKSKGYAAVEAAHTLEVMIDVQVAHMMYRDMLLETLRKGSH